MASILVLIIKVVSEESTTTKKTVLPRKIAVFASGDGSNLRAIHRAIQAGSLESVVLALVISNRSKSGAILFASEQSIPTRHLSIVTAETEEKLAVEMQKALSDAEIELIVLAGYLKQLPSNIVAEFNDRILNVHPALLPSFGGKDMYGARVHEAVIASGCKISGATVHFVSEVYDAGPIIMQECCAVHDEDTPQSLAERVLAIEHRILPKAIDLVARGYVEVLGGRVISKVITKAKLD
jgi:phosphoribosylglycinamide formyltransferase-1